ncbi:MAG: glycosyltransferase family 4 protein, partial [Bacteroidota bacterium]
MSRPDVIVSCATAPVGRGGLSQHFAQMIREGRDAGASVHYIATETAPLDGVTGEAIALAHTRTINTFTPVRFSRALKDHVANERFDRAVAARLKQGPTRLVGFVGKSLRTFAAARAQGTAVLEVMAANSHVDNVRARHAEALARYPFDQSWLSDFQRRKTLKEYDTADVVIAASPYTRDTFLARGFREDQIRLVAMTTLPRYVPPDTRPDDGVFRLVFVGSASVLKGVPVLVEAFQRLGIDAAELTIVGGPATRGMRKYLDEAVARDPRIQVRPGDPLPHLQRADVCVHPSFEDGHAYAPMEALACGSPVVVSADTGMKQHVVEGV